MFINIDNILLMINNYDKNEYKKISTNLEKLGLTEKEVLVYLDLLGRTTETGSTKIVLGTKLHRQYVYTALDSLEEKGLIKHVIKSGRKKFSANPPQRIGSLVEEKKIIAHEAIDILERLFAHPVKQEFEVYQGREQFVTHEFQLIRAADDGDFIDILGGTGSKFADLLGEERTEYNEMSIEKNIHIRFLGSEDQREYLESVKKGRINFEYCIIKGLQNSFVSTSIRKDNVTFQVYGNPILAFVLRSKEVAEDYRNLFETLWAKYES